VLSKPCSKRSKLARSEEIERRNAEERRRPKLLIAMVEASVDPIVSALGIGLALKNTKHAEAQAAQTYTYAVGMTSDVADQLLRIPAAARFPRRSSTTF